jgi:hypothetical protein
MIMGGKLIALIHRTGFSICPIIWVTISLQRGWRSRGIWLFD